jgi:PAS domain S-box-containing protein
MTALHELGAEPAHLFNRATVSVSALALIILAIDLWSPPGVVIDALYVLPLIVATLSGPPRFQITAALAISGLVVAGVLLSPAKLSAIVVTNHAIALAVIWTTTFVLVRFRRTWLSLQARTKDLADVNYALDQSAIVAVTDTTGTIKYVNDKFCEISKYNRAELIGQDHRLLNSGFHPKEFIRALWVTIANGHIWHGEIRNRAKDGSLYWVDTTIVPFLRDNGKPYQYMAIRYEITERKQSEARLREQAALARVGQMAAVVAHEVKNPIAGIRGALQVIGARMGEQGRDRAIIGDIIARLDALNRIVEDLLVFARPREVKAQTVDLNALVAGTAELISRDPALAGFRVQLIGGPATVQADGEQLQHVLQNIVMNGAQAMGGVGTMDVHVRPERGGWMLSFTDHGPGMSAAVREKAFDAFYTTKHRGTGLGLPIARRIVEAHGGHIEIDTPPSGGTVVSVFLPGPS